ncbi:hypothetical protein Tco_1198442 [Tanacetum coccineum]
MLNMNERVYNQQSQIKSSPVDLLQFDLGLVVPFFLPTDDPLKFLHKALAFMCTTLASISPSTNNQLETSSNPMNQDDMQGRQTLSYVCNWLMGNDHIARQNTQSRKVPWLKQKMILAELHEVGIQLSKEQLAILADTGDKVDYGPGAYTLFNNGIFQSDGIYSYDSDCNDLPSEHATFMANLSNHNSDIISEVLTYNTYHDNHVFKQNVQEIQDCEQQALVDDSNDEFTSESNMISYEQYLKESKSHVVHSTPYLANQNSMIMSVIEQMSNQVAKCNAEYKENQVINESLIAELERYKERIKTFEQRLNIDLNSREKLIDSQMDDIIRDRLALKQQIDSLKQNLSNQIKEKESLLQTFTIFKNESKEKESKYMDKEIDLENKIKELDNIVYKIAQRIKLTLYDGSVISRKRDAIFVTDEEETLILEELNQLSEDFAKCFVPQQELSAKQAFWFQMSNTSTESSDLSPVKVDVPSELPKVSLVNASLKKLKSHLAKFNFVVKTRNTHSALTEEVQTVFDQMKAAFDQCSVDKKLFEIEKKELKLENERLLEHISYQDVVNIVMHADLLVSQDLVHTAVNFVAAIKDYKSMEKSYVEAYNKFLELETELSKRNNMIEQEVSIELSKPTSKGCTISNLKKHIQVLNGKSVADCSESVSKSKEITLVVHKLDLEPLSLKLKNNKEAHVDYIRITKENANTLRDTFKQARTSNPLDNTLAYACMYTKQIQKLLVYVSDTCPSSPSRSEKLVAITPMNKAREVTFAKTSTTSEKKTQKQIDVHKTHNTNKPLVPFTSVKSSTNASGSIPISTTKNTRILQTSSSNQKYQRVEAHTRNAKPSLNKENIMSKSLCSTCKKCLFDSNHDLCVVNYLSDVNARARTKSVKSIKKKE